MTLKSTIKGILKKLTEPKMTVNNQNNVFFVSGYKQRKKKVKRRRKK